MSEQTLRQELHAAFKTRALIYYEIFNELSTELGDEKAEEILKKAIYRFGAKVGQKFTAYAPGDFTGLKNAFIGGIPDNGTLFKPEILHCDPDGLKLEFHHCPLMEGWLEEGLSDAEAERMCRIASIIDYGTFEGAGFHFEGQTWQRGKACQLKISPKHAIAITEDQNK